MQARLCKAVQLDEQVKAPALPLYRSMLMLVGLDSNVQRSIFKSIFIILFYSFIYFSIILRNNVCIS